IKTKTARLFNAIHALFDTATPGTASSQGLIETPVLSAAQIAILREESVFTSPVTEFAERPVQPWKLSDKSAAVTQNLATTTTTTPSSAPPTNTLGTSPPAYSHLQTPANSNSSDLED
ncbi:hypothetical protein LTR16_002084, partial [Cryomyces antarcticus]